MILSKFLVFRNALQEGVCLSLPFTDVPLQNLNLPQNGLAACCWKVFKMEEQCLGIY